MTKSKLLAANKWLDEVPAGRAVTSRELSYAVDITLRAAAHYIGLRNDFERMDEEPRRRAYWVKK